jgi:nicotinamide-nucleotide amidase
MAERLRTRGSTIAVAESITGGLLVNHLARADRAGQWLRGGVVAYASEVKHDVLAVRPGPVVSEEAACDMATGVMELLGAEVAVAVTGAGGPDPQDGQPPGTVWIAVVAGDPEPRLHHFSGDPPEVVAASCTAALEAVLAALD